MRLQFKLTGFNSGIQFRSIELPDIKYAMKGYQADMDGEQRYTGQIYEERGRGFLAMRGQFSYIGEGQKPALVSSVGDGDELKKLIKGEDWNDLHLIARGNTIIQMLNGRITSMLIDDDTAGRKARWPDRHTGAQGTAHEDRSAQYPLEAVSEPRPLGSGRPMPSIKKVAEIAGVSVGTVSHVITGSVPVSEPLRLKVQAAIRELNYHPNHVARSLKTSKTQTLGIIVPDMTISFFPQLIRGAETAARQRGYSLIAVNSDDDGERQKELLSLLRSQRVEGILLVIAAAPTPLNQLTRILDASIPMVCLDRIPDRVPVDSVSVDDVAAAEMGVEHLIAMGARRIAIATGAIALKNERRRLQGYKQALFGAGIAVEEDLIWHGNFRPEEVNALCRARLCNPARPPGRRLLHQRSHRPRRPARISRLRPENPARYRLRHLRRAHGGRSVLSFDYHGGATRLRYRLPRRADSVGPHRRTGEGDRHDHRPPPRHAENPRLFPPARLMLKTLALTQSRRKTQNRNMASTCVLGFSLRS